MSDITTKKINVYGRDTDPQSGVSNSYQTSEYAFRQPTIHMLVGQRAAGKSRACSKLISQAQKEKTFDQIYLISPSAKSNEVYFGKFIPEENIYYPTKDSVQKIIERVSQDRDEFQTHLEDLKQYNEFVKLLKKGENFSDDMIMHYMDLGFLADNFKKPVWKYEKFSGKLRPPTSAVVLDDVLGSSLLKSNMLESLFCTNRHIAPLNEPHSDRSACGLAIYILVQSYRNSGGGIPRVVRENLVELTLFKNKQKKQVDVIKDELASVVDEDKFERALEYATNKPYGHLTISFGRLKCPTLTFRDQFNQLLIFKNDEKECNGN